MAPTHGAVVPLLLGARVFVPRFIWGPTDPEYPDVNHWPMQTEFIELGNEGPSAVHFTVQGQVFSAVRVR
jgi:hypothetical protein